MTRFDDLQSRIAQIGLEHHGKTILANARRNAVHIIKTIRDVAPDTRPALVISAGPSLHKCGILARLSGFRGTIVASDGAYIQCLKAAIRPDWVVTIDPHPTRIVNWFGDTNYKENSSDLEYFQRQADFDPRFRAAGAAENAENIKAVDEAASPIVICASAPQNVVERTAAFDRYFFTPLVDRPVVGSLTRQLVEVTKAPALNTGGTVGTAAYVFARHVLKSGNVAVVGFDFGYPEGTPLESTQEHDLLKDEPNIEEFYPARSGFWGNGFTSPTYEFYLRNFLDLTEGERIINCSGGGFLQGPNVTCMEIEEWMTSVSGQR